MPTVKLIVARDQPALYDYLRWGFANTPTIQVIQDRRTWQRRARENVNGNGNGHEATPNQRRSRDRRRQAGARAELLVRGFVIER